MVTDAARLSQRGYEYGIGYEMIAGHSMKSFPASTMAKTGEKKKLAV